MTTFLPKNNHLPKKPYHFYPDFSSKTLSSPLLNIQQDQRTGNLLLSRPKPINWSKNVPEMMLASTLGNANERLKLQNILQASGYRDMAMLFVMGDGIDRLTVTALSYCEQANLSDIECLSLLIALEKLQ